MRTLIIGAALIASAGLSAADEMQENVGAGLGYILFKGHEGLLSQVSAATTNGSFGNQTFAITSGTSGAKRPQGFVFNREVRDFVNDNMDALARDMATGSGEALDTLAELIAVPAEGRAEFGATCQANFTEIFTSPTVTSDEVVANLAPFAPQI